MRNPKYILLVYLLGRKGKGGSNHIYENKKTVCGQKDSLSIQGNWENHSGRKQSKEENIKKMRLSAKKKKIKST